MTGQPGFRGAALGVLAGLAVASCTGSTSTSARSGLVGRAAVETRSDAYRGLRARLDTFALSGVVRTSEGLLLPERITIEIRSEICVESRQPGARFWSLEYDTCFAFVSRDSVDSRGRYSVSVPCIDADRDYMSRHAFGDLRLVQRGPVSFLAESDAGWRHQETFTSSRIETRNLELVLEPETFWVVRAGAVLRRRPRPGSSLLGSYTFGTEVPVIRFHKGWAQCLLDGRIGWMEMRYLGTEQEMKEGGPARWRPPEGAQGGGSR